MIHIEELVPGSHVKVTVKGRSVMGELISANHVVVVLDTPTGMKTIPTASVTKTEVL